MKKYKYYLFDLDDTLCNYRLAKKISNQRIDDLIGQNDINVNEFRKAYIENESVLMKQFLLGEINKDEYRNRRFFDIISLFDGDNAGKITQKLNAIFMEEGNKNVKLFDDVIPFIQKLNSHNKKLAIITNGPSDGQWTKIKSTGLHNYIDTVFISEEIGAAKPSQRIFNIALDFLGALPKEAIMIGDNVIDDYLAAKSVGIDALLINRFNNKIEIDCDQIISLEEINTIF